MFHMYREVWLLPRPVWVLFWAMVINRAGTMAIPFLTLFVHRSLGVSIEQASFGLTAFGTGGVIAGLFAGWWIDRWGAKRVILVSLPLSAFLLLLIPWGGSFWAILFLCCLFGLVSEAFRPAIIVCASSLVAPELRRQSFSLIRVAANIGMSIGPAVGGFVFGIHQTALFWVNATASLLAWLFLLYFPVPTVRPTEDTFSGSAFASLRMAWSDSRLVLLLGSFFPVLMVFFLSDSMTPLVLVEVYGFSPAAYGLLFTVNTSLIIVFELAVIGWTSSKSLASVCGVGAIAAGIGCLTMYLIPHYPTVVFGMMLFTIGEMLLFPATLARLVEISPDHARGSFMAAYMLSFQIAMILTPFFAGGVFAIAGVRGLWGYCLVLSSLSALLMWNQDTLARGLGREMKTKVAA